MSEKNNCVETPQVALEGTTINKAEKMTTIRISYNTREKLDALKIDKESYESVIQRLIERSAAKKCCAARWI